MGESLYNEVVAKNNSRYIVFLSKSKRYWLLFRLHPKLRKMYEKYKSEPDAAERYETGIRILNYIENGLVWRTQKMLQCTMEDFNVFRLQIFRRKTIDKSKRKKKDYFSVVAVVKNEARYIREFVLFYQITGADRIYLYDNDSSDNLLEMIEPFLETGYVVYRRWPGNKTRNKVQQSAYRDAIRRTKTRTKWLAMLDLDEFLFSPKGKVSDVLRTYEMYPGIAVNWVVFGPNGHTTRPVGLVLDNYTTTLRDENATMNCHVKSIVQPRKVSLIYHTHYALYKKGEYAVDTRRRPIDNRNSYKERMGRAFTQTNNRDVLRINHYITKSLEDLKEKCLRGYADGAPNADLESRMHTFDTPMVEDYTIKPYAEIVKQKMEKLT